MRVGSRRRNWPKDREGEVQTVSRESSKRQDHNDWILPQNTTIVASIILHAPGLSCVYHYNDDIYVIFGAVVGSICEGVFFYLLLAWLLKIYRERVNISKTRSSQTGHLWDYIARLPIILSIFLLVNALLVFPMGDYYFQSTADGVVADFQVVASAFHQAVPMLTWVGAGHSDYILQYVLVSCAAFGIANLTLGYGVHLHATGRYRKVHVRCWNTNKKNVIKAGILASLVYAVGAWSPVLHCSLCVAAVIAIEVVGTNQQQLSSKLANVELSRDILQQAQNAPNVVLLIHDSLSGSAMMNTNEGRNATPFFHSLLDDDDMYSFRNARSVSGTTQDGWTAIATGCLPFTKKGRETALESWIGSEFKRRGRHTSAFSSWKHNDKNSPAAMVYTYMQSMDVFVDPLTTGHELVNNDCSDDRYNVPMMQDWIRQNVTRSFFANIYSMNAHYPYLRDDTSAFPDDTKHRYFSSLETVDDFFRKLFGSLKESGQLENTIIIGSSDHGETYHKSKPFARMIQWDPNTLNTAAFMYIPKRLFPSSKARQTLLGNLNKTMSMLDIFPTMQHILYGGNAEDTTEARKANDAKDIHGDVYQENCITGMDLLGETIPDDRLAISWNIVHKPKSKPMLAALSNSERGFYIRKGWPRRNGVFEIDYGPVCTAKWTDTCVKKVTTSSRGFWRKAITELYNSSKLSKSVRESKFMVEMQKSLDVA